ELQSRSELTEVWQAVVEVQTDLEKLTSDVKKSLSELEGDDSDTQKLVDAVQELQAAGEDLESTLAGVLRDVKEIKANTM
ncbi:unnamed protein product, partial [Chrysoparadoxa australica]